MFNQKEIQNWLVQHIAELLEVAPETIDIHEPFNYYGLTSQEVVTLSGDLEEWLDRRLSPTIAYEYPDVHSLSVYLAAKPKESETILPEKSINDPASEPIAVIGISCRFPGANDPESFWQLLQNGKDMISRVPEDRWQQEVFYHPDPAEPGKTISRWGGFLNNIDRFDPHFFGISPIEAKYMDPQQRLLLELSYEALDDAGQSKEKLDGSNTGVFIGISGNDYSYLQLVNPLKITSHSGTGNALSVAANRISYFYNFHGPSIAIDTACSSSLSAVHVACKSLRSGECRQALVGGINLILSPAQAITMSKAGVLSPDGRCKTFDTGANGYVRGEGGGLVVLKPLSAAVADGDPVQALILGSAMHHDGRTNGLMAPSSESQETLLKEAYRLADVSPEHIQYIEAHGTGTLLGDLMEAKALGAVVGKNRSNGSCAIGSVKTNIGHLEAAAGIAGLIKVVLSIKHGKLPPSLHFQTPNPHIAFNDLKLRVQQKLSAWPSHGPLMAGVSSFGFGGTNVHVVISAPDHKQRMKRMEQDDSSTSGLHLLPLSGTSYDQLQNTASSFKKVLDSDSFTVEDLCIAAALRRSAFNHRIALMGNSRTELIDALQAFLQGNIDPNLLQGDIFPDQQPRLVFVFPGQGSQWLGMGRKLLKQEPEFFQVIASISQIIEQQYNWSLLELLTDHQDESRFNQIHIIQPVLFAIEVALARLWQSWGIAPDAIVGHSMGEVAAAPIAGILDLEDAIDVICRRSKLLQPFQGKGNMLVTELSPEQAEEFIEKHHFKISVAVINSPSSTVLSGDPLPIKEAMEALQRKNIFCRLVNVEVASHSPQMDHLKDKLLEELREVNPKEAKIPFYSTVLGKKPESCALDAEYWMDNLRKPVLFSDTIAHLINEGHSIFLEISPHPILLGAIQQCAQSSHKKTRLLPSLRKEEPEREVLCRTLGILYAEGYEIDWAKFYPDRGNYVPLPLIKWQRQRYWIDTVSENTKTSFPGVQTNGRNFHPLLGHCTELANSSFVWQNELDLDALNYLNDHRVEGEVVFPGSAFIEMALQACTETRLKSSYEFSEFSFREKLILKKGKSVKIQALLTPAEEGFSFSIYSRNNEQEVWIQNASVNLIRNQNSQKIRGHFELTPDAIREEATSKLNGEEFYQNLQQYGISYGPAFRNVEFVWRKDNHILGQLNIPGSAHFDGFYQFHPALLDAGLQVIASAKSTSLNPELYIPAGCEQIRFFSNPDRLRWSQLFLHSEESTGIRADLKLMDENHEVIAELIGFQIRRVKRKAHLQYTRKDTWFYQIHWKMLKEDSSDGASTSTVKQWLILADDTGSGQELARHLRAGGDHCHFLSTEKSFQLLENDDQEAFQKFVEDSLNSIISPLDGIVHFFEYSKKSDGLSLLYCNSILYLIQILSRHINGMPRLYLVTKGAQSVTQGQPVAVEQSPVWGLGKVISFEIPELQCKYIDLDPQMAFRDSIPLLKKQINREDNEDQIAIRDGKYYVARIRPFEKSFSRMEKDFSLRSNGTYLITGGLGGLGLEVAKWMVHRKARHLVLLGRRDPSQSVRNVIDELRQQGVELVIAKVDVSDDAQLEKLLSNIKEGMPELRGVIHAAGVLDDGSLLNFSGSQMQKVMAAKVNGTWNLHKSTLNIPLDFFIFFSSAVSVLGSPGQGNYAAASAFLDAMAHYRKQSGLPALSINWGPWAEVGLAAKSAESLNSTKHLIKMIEIDQGLSILEQLMNENMAQVVVLPFDLQHLIELYPKAAGFSFFSELQSNKPLAAQTYARPKLRQKYIAPRNEMERKLAALWRQTLHIDRVGIYDSFFELGGDSVLGAQIIASAQKIFGLSIDPQEAFKKFTIEQLAKALEEEIIKKVENMTEEEAKRRISNK